MFTSVKAFIELLDVTSAPVDIPVSFVFSASVKALVSEFASYAVFISEFVWSAVAPASMPFNLV